MSKPKKINFSQVEAGIKNDDKKPEFGQRRGVLRASIVGAAGLGLLALFGGCKKADESEWQKRQACLSAEQPPSNSDSASWINDNPECIEILRRYLSEDRFIDSDYIKAVDMLRTVNPRIVSDLLLERLDEIYALSLDDRKDLLAKIAEIGDLSALPSLITHFLFCREQEFCNSAALVLAKSEDPRAKCVIDGALLSNYQQIRDAAVLALGELGDDRAVQPLVERLTSLFPHVTWREEELFGGCRGSQLVPSKIENAVLMSRIMELLGDFGDARAIPILSRFAQLAIGKPLYHETSCSWPVFDQYPHYGPCLEDRINDTTLLRADAISILGRLAPVGDNALIPLFLDIYSKEEYGFGQLSALRTLARIGDSRVTAILENALSTLDAESILAEEISAGLERIRGNTPHYEAPGGD